MTFRDLRLKYADQIKNLCRPNLVYYPACGADTVPKTTFGDHNVIHLSLPGEGSHTHGGFDYFHLLGDGIKLYGDMDKSPLAENSIDLIWLKLGGITPSPEALKDFNRVLKTSGFIYVEEYHFYQPEKWDRLIGSFSDYENKYLDFPENGLPIYSIIPKSFAQNPVSPEEYEKNSQICSSEKDMMDIVTSQHLHHGEEIIPRRALFQKQT